jgi:shikimate 5-dehydrogenase
LLKGFAITIPYKREVISFLSVASPEVTKMNDATALNKDENY